MDSWKIVVIILVSLVLTSTLWLIYFEDTDTEPNKLSELSEGDFTGNVSVYWFYTENDSYSDACRPFLDKVEGYEAVNVTRINLGTMNDTNPEAMLFFQQMLRYHNISASDAGVPATFAGDEYWIGYGEGWEEDVEGYLVDCVLGEVPCGEH